MVTQFDTFLLGRSGSPEPLNTRKAATLAEVQAVIGSGGIVEGARQLHVETNGSDTTGTGTAAAPFLSVGKAYTVGVTLSPTATNPVQIMVGTGTFPMTSLNAATDFLHITARGVGTVFVLSGLLNHSANSVISGMTLRADPTFSTAIYTQSAFVLGQSLRNVLVYQANGTAIDTIRNQLQTFYIEAATCIATVDGAQVVGGLFNFTVKGIAALTDNEIQFGAAVQACDFYSVTANAVAVTGVAGGGTRPNILYACKIHLAELTGASLTIGVTGTSLRTISCHISAGTPVKNISESNIQGSYLESDNAPTVDGLASSASIERCYLVTQGGGLANISGAFILCTFEGDGQSPDGGGPLSPAGNAAQCTGCVTWNGAADPVPHQLGTWFGSGGGGITSTRAFTDIQQTLGGDGTYTIAGISSESIVVPTGSDLMILVQLTQRNDAVVGAQATYNIFVDGTISGGCQCFDAVAGQAIPVSLMAIVQGLSAGSHTIQVKVVLTGQLGSNCFINPTGDSQCRTSICAIILP